MINVDELAQEIHRVDGNHDKGASALAESLLPFLTAAFAAMPGPAVKVKPLEWDEPRCGPDEYKTTGKADALGFYYILERRYMSDRFTVTRSSDIQPFAWEDSPDAAKAAAQADCLARILSALTPAPDLASENERLRAALEVINKEAKVANDVIRMNRDGGGNGRVKVATSMHRIEQSSRAALERT
ncbi:MAG: hypothetical protein H5U22_06720 [Rhizobium sp.]|nr:hypothetical protein [Rhizobium sp.]